ncbi:hypothetical protein FB451DRAFT_1171688 [Mycena latifolia]|nr:hypothetical protein FB451DRAFT_1171688 [Mycena latifolia]
MSSSARACTDKNDPNRAQTCAGKNWRIREFGDLGTIRGLPTVPVFTGVTGAVNGMPSRPVEHFPDEIYGAGTGRQNCRPSRQSAAVDGRIRVGHPVTRSDTGIKERLRGGSTFPTGLQCTGFCESLAQDLYWYISGYFCAPRDRPVNSRLTAAFLPSRPVGWSPGRNDDRFYDGPYSSRVLRLTAVPVYGTVGSPKRMLLLRIQTYFRLAVSSNKRGNGTAHLQGLVFALQDGPNSSVTS